MIITCDRCGYEASGEEFRHIGNAMCCGPLTFRECPSCKNPVICDRQEMREEIESTAREISCRIEAAVTNGDTAQARDLLKELSFLNQCLNLDAINDYVREKKREVNRIERAAASSP